MKKLLYILLCAVMLTGLTIPVFAAEPSADHDQAATGSSRDHLLANETGETADVNVDIEWESMIFTYNAGSRSEWNAQTHSYQTSDGGWTDRTAKITVTNHSETGVLAEFTFTGNSGIRGTFTKPQLMLFGADATSAPSASTQFGIDPDSAAISEDGTLGQITVDIQPIATATNAETLDLVLTELLNSGSTELQILLPPDADASMLAVLRTKLNNFPQPVSLMLGGVTTIPESAFNDCQKLRAITLPDGITLEDWTFQNCANLESVDMPCVQTIGRRAFENCYKLTTANLPNAESVGEYAFTTCKKLTACNLSGASVIGEYAFHACYQLSEITLPNLQIIPNGLFYDCRKLTSITFLQIITKVGSGWIESVSTGDIILTLNAEQGNIGGKTTKFGENGTFGDQTFKEVRKAE